MMTTRTTRLLLAMLDPRSTVISEGMDGRLPVNRHPRKRLKAVDILPIYKAATHG